MQSTQYQSPLTASDSCNGTAAAAAAADDDDDDDDLLSELRHRAVWSSCDVMMTSLSLHLVITARESMLIGTKTDVTKD